jgi:hypothetical protein
MKKVVILLCMSLVMGQAWSQKENPVENRTAAQSDLQQKIDLKNAEKKAASKRMEEMILNKQFILEVSFIKDQSGNLLNTPARIDVSSSMNYIAIDLNKIVLRLEPNTYQTSNWPFNDFAVNGTISKYSFEEFKKPDEGYIIRFHTDGRIGTYDFTYKTSANGKAALKIESNNGITLSFEGVIVPLNQSRIKPMFI